MVPQATFETFPKTTDERDAPLIDTVQAVLKKLISHSTDMSLNALFKSPMLPICTVVEEGYPYTFRQVDEGLMVQNVFSCRQRSNSNVMSIGLVSIISDR